MKFIWIESAESDLLNAYYWYESRQPGLGSKLLKEIGRHLEKIMRTIIEYRRYFHLQRIRYLLFSKFPFYIFFVKEELIGTFIVALLHKRQNIRGIIEDRL